MLAHRFILEKCVMKYFFENYLNFIILLMPLLPKVYIFNKIY